MNEHEEKFIRVFIVPDKRDRYLSLFETRKGRPKLNNRLNHNHDLDTRFLHKVPTGKQSSGSILALLKQRGAPPNCYVISCSQLDGRHVDLKDALEETVGYGVGTVISCIPGELGYFEAEEPGERYLLYRL
jgi:hypothetical protein